MFSRIYSSESINLSVRSGSWNGSIFNGRKRIARLLKEQPSLKTYIPEILPTAYADGVEIARRETGLPADISAECPYSPSQILDFDFLPGDEELPKS